MFYKAKRIIRRCYIWEECICIKDYKVFKKGQKYQYEVGRYVLIFYIGDETFTIGESEFYNYFRDCD